MKVLAITNLFGFPWDNTRGIFNQQQFELLAQQVDLRVLVTVPWPEVLQNLRAYNAARRQSRLQGHRIDYVIFWYPPRLLQTWHPLFFFLSLALQRPATLFVHRAQALIGSWAFPDGVATSVVGRLTNTPVLMKVHGTDINDYLQRPGRRWQILAAMKHSAGVLAVSEALRNKLVQAGVPAGQVSVLYNGVDAAVFRPVLTETGRAAARNRVGLAAGDAMLLFVGNLKAAKGCLDLMAAFTRLAARADRHLYLTYIGSGPDASELRRQAVDAGLADRVRLMGKLAHRSLPDWMAAARLVCLPSHAEGVPNVLLEAMSCGTPVVATQVGGVSEVVPEFAGVLLAPHDQDALVAGLQSALTRVWDSARIAAHARQFSWDANVQGLLHHLRRVTSVMPKEGATP